MNFKETVEEFKVWAESEGFNTAMEEQFGVPVFSDRCTAGAWFAWVYFKEQRDDEAIYS